MNVYLCARFARRVELRRYAADLERDGHTVTSAWIWIGDEASDETFLEWAPDDEKRRAAEEDYVDLCAADCLIAFTNPPGSYRGGARHVELGLGIAMEKTVILVGPREHLMHWLPVVVQRESWEAARLLVGSLALRGHAVAEAR